MLLLDSQQFLFKWYHFAISSQQNQKSADLRLQPTNYNAKVRFQFPFFPANGKWLTRNIQEKISHMYRQIAAQNDLTIEGGVTFPKIRFDFEVKSLISGAWTRYRKK